jgi:AAA domain/Protein of unknown function (DUF4011)
MAGRAPEDQQRRDRLAQLRGRFIAVNLRSRSLRLTRITRSGALDLCGLAATAPAALEQVKAALGRDPEAGVELVSMKPRREAQGPLVASISYLYHRAREAWLETGARDLAVGWPFLEGCSADGVWLRAPLLLYPAELVPVREGRHRWELRLHGPPNLNESLAQTLARLCGVGLSLDELLQDDDDRVFALDTPTYEGIGACLRRLGLPTSGEALPDQLAPLEPRSREAREGAERDHFHLRHHLVLGRFPAAASSLVADYDALQEGEVDDAALGLAAQLLQVDEALAAAPGGDGDGDGAGDGDGDSDGLGPREHLVLDSDSSQDAVLAWVARDRPGGLVVQGPPGTGKSQLIANLVAAALARGWRALLVCQKRAALDVVADRLESVGLREPIALVHDIHRDRSKVFAGISASLERARQGGDEASLDDDAAEFSRTLARLQGRVEAGQGAWRLLARRQGGRPGLAVLDERALADDDRPLPDLTEVAAEVGEAEAAAALPRLEAYARQTAELAAPHPLSGRDDWADASEGQIRVAFASLERFRQTLDAMSVIEGAVQTPAQSAKRTKLWCAAAPLLELVEAHDLSVRRFELFWVWCGGNAEHGPWNQVVELLEGAQRDYAPTPEELVLEQEATLKAWIDELGRLKEAARRWYRVFLPRFWRLRKLPGRILDRCHSWAEALAQGGVVDVADLCRRALRWQELIATMPSDNPFFDFGFTGRMKSLEWALEDLRLQHDNVAAVHRMREALAGVGEVYADLPKIGPESDELWAAPFFKAALADWQLGRLQINLRQQVEAAAAAPGFAELLGRAAEQAGAGDLEQADRMLADVQQARGEVDAARANDRLVTDEPRWVKRFLRGWRPPEGGSGAQGEGDPAADATVALERAWRVLGLGDRTRVALEAPLVEPAALEALAADLAACRDTAHQGVLAAYTGRLATALAQGPEGVALRKLEEEARKQRRRVTLRQLVSRYWAGAPDEQGRAQPGALALVRPVWFGSPETVSALFPLQPDQFDLIIFDEASQCPVECGVPVLVRGRRAVVAGDEKQMPPSHFFQAVDNDPEDDEEATLLASHSLLALSRVALGSTTLRWHYRSRHEGLIAFSNHAFYGGRLITAPSAAGTQAGDFTGLNWQRVVGGRWHEQTNRAEAEAAVALIQQLLDRAGPDGALLTVGVVCFNLSQAELIERLLEEAALADPAGLGRLLDKDRARPPVDQLFVRNLENVQGDERDVIIFSVGYAPKEPGGRVHARFGPLGLAGGENRLNVAVTRARQGIWILCSFDPDELDVAGTKNPGPKLLKLYLKYVRAVAQSRLEQAARLLDRAAELTGEPGAVAAAAVPAPGGDRRVGARVRQELAAALRDRGEEVAEQYGLGALRIDLALPQRRLAVDCGGFLTAEDPLTRDVYGPRFWRRMGWTLQRVTPGMWGEGREAVLALLLGG